MSHSPVAIFESPIAIFKFFITVIEIYDSDAEGDDELTTLYVLKPASKNSKKDSGRCRW
jgi:hypothetical protein